MMRKLIRNEAIMKRNSNKTLKDASPYSAVLTREQFLFYETRITAKLLEEGLSREEVIDRIVAENLFQYPTEKSIRRMALVCCHRLEALNDKSLQSAIATQPSEVAKQICLYAMMKQYRLVWDFMITVIGSKYRNFDMSFGKIDLNTFFARLQEQDSWVATWSDSTVAKIKQVLAKILVENDYLDSISSDHLNPVLISTLLENRIRSNNDNIALAAFNCLM